MKTIFKNWKDVFRKKDPQPSISLDEVRRTMKCQILEAVKDNLDKTVLQKSLENQAQNLFTPGAMHLKDKIEEKDELITEKTAHCTDLETNKEDHIASKRMDMSEKTNKTVRMMEMKILKLQDRYALNKYRLEILKNQM